jgi:tetratricopeptide (TPR) repeat protein
LVEQEPSLPPSAVLLSWFLLADGKRVEGGAWLERAAAEHPDRPRVYLTLGQLAWSAGRLADASVHFEKAITMRLPDSWSPPQSVAFSAKVFDLLSAVYEQQGRWPAAAKMLTAVIRLRPGNANLHTRLARAAYFGDQIELSKEQLRRVQELDPNAAPTPLALAQFAFAARDFAAVEAALGEALENFADDPRTHLWLAQWRMVEGDAAEARASLQQAVRLGAPGDHLSGLRAEIALMAGDYQAAAKHANEFAKPCASAKRPDCIHRRNLLTLALAAWSTVPSDRQERVLGQALNQAERNVSQAAADGPTTSLLGWVYALTNQLPEAESMLIRATQLSPHVTPEQVYFYAYFLSQTGKTEDQDRAQALLEGVLSKRHVKFLLRPLAQSLLEQLDSSSEPEPEPDPSGEVKGR